VGENISKSDIVATADMNTLNSLNTLQVEFSVPKVGNQIGDIRGSTDSVRVSIENKKNVQLVLKTNVTGNAPEGYVVGNVTTDQNLVRVSGPESAVNRVVSAGINIDMSTLSEFTSDITTSVPVRLYDEEGNEVEGSTLTKNPESVMITIEILSTKEVPLRFEVEGEPADGYGLTGAVTSDVQTVWIAGKRAALNAVNEIVIPAEAIDVSGISEDMTAEIDICDYLPENIQMADKSSSMPVNVTVGVERETTVEYTLQAKNVKLLNVPEGLKCELEGLEEEYPVSVTGIRSVMSGLTEENLEAAVDVAEWAREQGIREVVPGRYLVALQFNNPEYTEIDRPVTVSMTVSEVTEEDTEE
jgi:YbbR domain-containing protein